jgi:hypothetical protein
MDSGQTEGLSFGRYPFYFLVLEKDQLQLVSVLDIFDLSLRLCFETYKVSILHSRVRTAGTQARRI